MPTLRVAGAQMCVKRDVAENTTRILDAISRAADLGAEILLTPEGSLSGYRPTFDPAEVAPALDQVVEHAMDRCIALALGTCFIEEDGRCYNQIRFYTADGDFLGFHAKTLRCGTLADPPAGEINDYAVRPLRTFSVRGITIGGLICNDLWANPACTPMPDPHLSQQLAEKGARIIFHAVNGGRSDSDWSHDIVRPYHRTNLQMRAKAAGAWIVTCDNAAPVALPTSSPSGVISPNGAWAVLAPDRGEHLFTHDIPLD